MKKEKHFIFAIISIVMYIITFIALCLPLLTAKGNGYSDITLGEATFGKTESGVELCTFSLLYFMPLACNIFTLLLVLLQFFKLKPTPRIILNIMCSIISAIAFSLYMTFKCDALSLQTNDPAVISGFMAFYNAGYAYYVAAIAGGIAAMVQVLQANYAVKLRRKAKEAKKD